MGQGISRREFLTSGAVTTAALGLAGNATKAGEASPAVKGANPGPGNWVRWLDGRSAAIRQGVTWGTPWPRGKLKSAKHFALRGPDELLSLQSWPMALAASVVAMLPCLSPCCCLGLPIGIWSLVVLLDNNVKASFV